MPAVRIPLADAVFGGAVQLPAPGLYDQRSAVERVIQRPGIQKMQLRSPWRSMHAGDGRGASAPANLSQRSLNPPDRLGHHEKPNRRLCPELWAEPPMSVDYSPDPLQHTRSNASESGDQRSDSRCALFVNRPNRPA